MLKVLVLRTWRQGQILGLTGQIRAPLTLEKSMSENLEN